MYKYITLVFIILWAGTPGFTLPEHLKMEILTSGLSSGHIADIHISNEGVNRFTGVGGPFVIFFGDKYAPLWVDGFYMNLAPGKSMTVRVRGTTLIFTLPIPPKGHKIQKSAKWFEGSETGLLVPGEDLSDKNGVSVLNTDKLPDIVLTYPGTEVLFPYKIDPFLNPGDYAKFMLEAETWIRITYKRLKAENKIQTVLSGDARLEEDFITQILSWTVSGLLTGDPFKQKELYEQVLTKYLQATGSKESKLPGKVQQALKRGSEDIWNAVLYNGQEAGLIRINGGQKGDQVQVTYRPNTGMCLVRGKRLFVEDPSVCDWIGGKFTPASTAEFTAFTAPKSPVSLDELDHLIGVGNEVDLSGKLKGNLNDVTGLFASVKNEKVSGYKIDLNRQTGKFRFSNPALRAGENAISIKATTKQGKSISVLKSVFNIEQDTIRLVRGGSITIDRRSVFLRTVRSSSILLYDGSVSYPLMRGNNFALNGAQISLYQVDPGHGSAKLIIKRKVCGYPGAVEKETRSDQNVSKWMGMKAFPALQGYKGVILPEELGYRIPEKRVLAVMSSYKVTPGAIVCGWQMTDHLKEEWGGLLSRSLMEILTDLKKKNSPKLKDVEVIYVDTLSRQVISSMDTKPFPEPELWVRKKLLNPDYILDSEVRFSCCKVKRAPTCTSTSVKVELYVRLIESRTGRIVTTYSKGLGRRDVEDDLICMDFYSKGAKEYRDLILQEFTKNAVDYFRDYMAGRW